MPPFKKPPIVEVVMGVFFEPIASLDPMLLGTYWSERRDDFPTRKLAPAVADRPGLLFSAGVAPTRCWLESDDEQYLVQLQPDRFYFNWRRRHAEYPRFGDHGGKAGVCTRGLSEYERFASFCEREGAAKPTVRRVELSKVDRVAYTDREDLAKLVPLTASLAPLLRSTDPEIDVRIAERHEDVDLMVQLTAAVMTPDLVHTLHVELRASVSCDEPTAEIFRRLEDCVDAPFEQLFSDEAKRRFEPVEEP